MNVRVDDQKKETLYELLLRAYRQNNDVAFDEAIQQLMNIGAISISVFTCPICKSHYFNTVRHKTADHPQVIKCRGHWNGQYHGDKYTGCTWQGTWEDAKAAKPACDHQWGIDGAHSNEYCKKCFVSRTKADPDVSNDSSNNHERTDL